MRTVSGYSGSKCKVKKSVKVPYKSTAYLALKEERENHLRNKPPDRVGVAGSKLQI
jgi:hypothetical protein